MTDPELLRAECRVLVRALTGGDPDPTLTEAYVRGHAHPSLAGSPSALDRRLLGAARGSVGGARTADAYAALFDRRGMLRRKLVFLYALLETTPPHHRIFERAPVGRLRACWTLVRSGTAGLLRLLVALLRFGPFHLAIRRRGEP